MKKFMKAIAFVTVVCMALSTVAFAESVKLDGEKVLNITVTGAGNDQVALVVVETGTTIDAPLFIDQKAAVDGTAEFTATLTNATVEAVDIYVGYATYANENSAPKKIGTNVALVENITEVTIANFDTEIVQGDSLKGEQQTGAGVAITFDVKAPKGVYATDMIWAIRYREDGVEKTKFTESFDVSEYGIGIALTSGVELGLAFLNGFDRLGEEIASVEITDVDAIFLFTDGEEFFTEANDEILEAK